MSTSAKVENSPAAAKEASDFAKLEPGAQLDQIAAFLREKGDYVRTLDIAKQFCGAGATCKDINPRLYELLKQKRVEKAAEANGSKPRWKAV